MLTDKITVSFLDVLQATEQTHEDLIKALAAEVASGFQSCEANEIMSFIVILAGLEHLKINNQLAATNELVSKQLLTLINGTGVDVGYGYLTMKSFMSFLNKLIKNEPIGDTGRKLLEGLLLCVCTKKETNDIESADCNVIFKNPVLRIIMNHVQKHTSEERIKAVRHFEPDHLVISAIPVPPSNQNTAAVNSVAPSAFFQPGAAATNVPPANAAFQAAAASSSNSASANPSKRK